MTSKKTNTQATKKKTQGNTNKDTYGKKADEKQRANKTARVKWGEENERQMTNNIMREIGIVMGTWYVDFCADSPSTAPEILLATS